MANPGDALHDIADPQPLLPGIEVPLWFWIVVGALVVAVTGVLLFLLLRGKPEETPAQVSSYAESKRALEQLRESLPGRSLAEIATDASLIMRHYLAVTLQEPALYETHEEFIMRSDALEGLPSGARERLAPLLDRLAEAKYGPSGSQDTAARNLVESCLEALQGVDSTQAKRVA